MPKLERLGPSATVLRYNTGTEILYSYETPVAAFVATGPKESGAGEWIKSEKFFSRTTSKHVGKFIPKGVKAAAVPHAEIERIANRGEGA